MSASHRHRHAVVTPYDAYICGVTQRQRTSSSAAETAIIRMADWLDTIPLDVCFVDSPIWLAYQRGLADEPFDCTHAVESANASE